MPEPDYIVLRAYPEAPGGWMPPPLEGCWYDRSEWVIPLDGDVRALPTGFAAVAQPTGRFEFREDGKCAEVWEVRPCR